MHPAISVIVFTVASGAGFGLLILAALFSAFGIGGGLSLGETMIAGGLGLVLATVGLLSSTFHLANPKNAWRAFNRFRTSWLSREGVFAVFFYPFAILYFGGLWFLDGAMTGALQGLAVLTILLAVAVVFSTGMIYACLRTIRQWNTSLVPANYLLMALASGGVLLTTVLAYTKGQAMATVATTTLTLLVAAGIGKSIYYFWIGKPQGSTINTATGFTRAGVRLFESGQSGGAFLNKEFGYQAPISLVHRLRLVVFVLAFVIPLVLVALLIQNGMGVLALVTVFSILAGLAVERWLFFAEARHVVNLFYGAQST